MNINNCFPFFMRLGIVCLIILNSESNQNMNNHIKISGSFFTHDKLGIPVTLEWHKTNIISPDFAAYMKNVWNFARDAYMPVEMDFLKTFPEVVGTEPYFAPFEPLFAQGLSNIQWNKVEKTMESLLKSHFVFDPSQFPPQMIEMFTENVALFVTIKEQSTKTTLGFITFLMRKKYPVGDVKVMSFAVNIHHQKRGLGKLLMSSIFNIIPDVKRIFLCTRVTNNTALHAYRTWGFVIDKNPILDHEFNLKHWTFMEYKADQCDILQKTTQTFNR